MSGSWLDRHKEKPSIEDDGRYTKRQIRNGHIKHGQNNITTKNMKVEIYGKTRRAGRPRRTCTEFAMVKIQVSLSDRKEVMQKTCRLKITTAV